MRTALYRLFNVAGELLYVGITWQPLPSRMKGHVREQPWWQEVHHATVIWYETREEADRAETEAIKAEHPKYNIAKALPQRSARPRIRCFAPRGIPDGGAWPSELLMIEGWLRPMPPAHFNHLLNLDLLGVTLRIIPDDAKWKTVPVNSFTLYENQGSEGSFVVIDLPHEQTRLTGQSEVSLYRQEYALLRQDAVTGDEARDLIHRAMRELGP